MKKSYRIAPDLKAQIISRAHASGLTKGTKAKQFVFHNKTHHAL